MIFSRTQVSLTKAEFTALLAHSNPDPVRAYQHGVYFDAPRMRGVATDGHRLAVCEGEGNKGEWTYLVPRDAVMVALKAKGGETFIVTPATGDIVAMDKANRKVGTFPAEQPSGVTFVYEHVMSAAPSTHVRQAFNTKYLGDLRYVTDAALKPSQWQSIACYPAEDELSPAQFRVGAWTVYLMPAAIGNDAKDKALTDAWKGKGSKAHEKAPRAAQDSPSTAIVLAGSPRVVDATIVDSRAIQAIQIGHGMAIEVSALPPRTPLQTWREAHVSSLSPDEQNKPHVKAWLADAARPQPTPRANCAPWG